MVKHMSERSRAPHGAQKALAHLPLLALVAYIGWSHYRWGLASHTAFLSIFFLTMGTLVVYFIWSGIYWRTFTHQRPVAGRVLAIVPVYNEEPELVYAVVRSLLRQSILPDEIHIVDDGSAEPLPHAIQDPLVTWHRIPNSGKRHAQAHVLQQYSPQSFDYILTVDSDSVLQDDSLAEMLKAFQDDRIQAATGMIFVRNWQTNFLSRLTDINVVTSCLQMRMSRSWLGIVSPTSGALAMYRASIVYDNLDDYLTSGTAGDDRRLSFYALQRGQVVGVHEAVASTQLPIRWGDCFNQRMRWAKSAWLGIPFVLTNLRWLVVLFYAAPLVFSLLWPFVVAALLTLTFTVGSPVIMYGVLWWMAISITQGGLYAIYRPGFDVRTRLQQFGLTFVYPVLGLVILRPAAYWALTKLKDNSWHTREQVEIPTTAGELAAPDALPKAATAS